MNNKTIELATVRAAFYVEDIKSAVADAAETIADQLLDFSTCQQILHASIDHAAKMEAKNTYERTVALVRGAYIEAYARAVELMLIGLNISVEELESAVGDTDTAGEL